MEHFVYIMFRVLLLLATFMQVYFNLLNLQQMIIINAFHGLRRRRLIAIQLHRRILRRRRRRHRPRFWRLPLFDASDQFIKFPTTPAETAASIETFRENTRSELGNVAGAINGTLIKIIAPRENALDYFSRYQQHDFIIQIVVDGRGKVIDAVCGFPGSAHDARVLRNSELHTER